MFSIVPFSISLILLLNINFSNANEVYIEEYKDIQYPEYPQDFVIELPVYEPIRDHSIQNDIVPQTYVPLHFNGVETTTISSIFHNKYEEPIMEASNVQHFQEYMEMKTSNPEKITTQVPMITSTTNVNESQDSMIPIQITDDPEANQLISKFKIKYNQKSVGKKSFQTKSQQIKSPNKKREISKNLLQDPDIQSFKYNIKNSTNSQKINKIKKMKKRFRNRKNQQNPKEFNGFGHTFKTLNNFLNTDKFFTDILKPIENNLDEIENKPIRPIKTNIYTLIAKAASLKNDDNDNDSSTQKNSDIKNKKPISKKLHKRNNIVKRANIETDSYIPIEKEQHTDAFKDDISVEGKFLGREKRQEKLRKGVKNFKLTMKMLSNIDKYVSSMLQNYFEKLSNYIDDDDEENDVNEDEDN